MGKPTRYWFPAKTYGWGWGAPATWQGWVVSGLYVGLLVLGGFVVPPTYGDGAFLLCILVLTVALFGVCWAKGEPPRWRWGKE